MATSGEEHVIYDRRSARWRKSRHSNPSGNCVEMTSLPEGGAAFRDSRDPDGPILRCSPDGAASFVRAAKLGAFDR